MLANGNTRLTDNSNFRQTTVFSKGSIQCLDVAGWWGIVFVVHLKYMLIGYSVFYVTALVGKDSSADDPKMSGCRKILGKCVQMPHSWEGQRCGQVQEVQMRATQLTNIRKRITVLTSPG